MSKLLDDPKAGGKGGKSQGGAEILDMVPSEEFLDKVTVEPRSMYNTRKSRKSPAAHWRRQRRAPVCRAGWG